MFAQVILGTVKDRAGLLAQFQKWDRDLKPGASGYLGTTAGVAEDGRFITVARFDSTEDARANSDRPEQGQWWAETALYVESDVVFHDCRNVQAWLDRCNDDAGFVQVIQAKTNDVETAKRFFSESPEELEKVRPDVMGTLVAWHDDAPGEFTQVVYFTSEEQARLGEKQMESSKEFQEAMKRYAGIMEGEATYIDVSSPWYSSP